MIYHLEDKTLFYYTNVIHIEFTFVTSLLILHIGKKT